MKKLFLLLVVAFYSHISSGQTATEPVAPQPIPPAPNAASLGKYGEIPVGKYTGVPEINIPLYEISEGDLTVPISLSYHASGVKVEDNASWVGLGWSLNAGGVITRSVRGKPDEVGYLINPTYASTGNPATISNALPSWLVSGTNVNFNSASDCDIENTVGYMYNVANNVFDSEPDIYYYNFNGLSGKFVLDQNGNAYTIPFQKIYIQRIDNNNWKITTTDGNVYTFNQPESTTSVSLKSLNYGGPPQDGNGKSSTFISSWYLSTIQSPTGHHVDFSYTPEYSVVTSGWSQSILYASLANSQVISSPIMNATASQNNIHGLRLQQINFSNGNIVFNAPSTRTDIDDYINPNYLSSITINNKINTVINPIKNFVFNTDYFTSTGTQSSLTRRLRLNSVTEWSGDMTSSKSPYLFTYDSSHLLPSKVSTSQDNWGFYNGKTNLDAQNKPTLISTLDQSSIQTVQETEYNVNYKYVWEGYSGAPVATGLTIFKDSPFYIGLKTIAYQGADRTPDFNFAKAGILTQITYPTGGYTTFTYEPNDYNLGPANWVYDTQPSNIGSYSSNDNNINQGLWTTVVDNGTTCINTQTFRPSSNIPPSSLNLNGTVSVDLNFGFSNGHPNSMGSDDIYCCGFNMPEAVLTDVTTNTKLFDIMGQVNVTEFYDQSIVQQINSGTIKVVGTFTYPYTASQPVWNAHPFFSYTGVQLDPTHTYTLSTITYHNIPGSCDGRSSCPKPTTEIFTSATAVATYYIKNDQVTQYNGVVGGLRIKQISDYSDPASPIIKNYSYRLSSNPAISSGVILDWPSNMSTFNFNPDLQTQVTALTNGNSASFLNYYTHQELLFTSGSKFELGQTAGSFVGYKEVDESYCPDNTCATLPIGKKIYRYTSPDDYPNVNTGVFGQAEIVYQNGAIFGNVNALCPNFSTTFSFSNLEPGTFSPYANIYPFAPKTDYDFKRGLLLSEETYDGTGVLKRQVTSSYNAVNDSNNYKIISGLKLGTPPNPLGPHYPTITNWSFARYDIIAAWNYKTQDVITEIDNNNNKFITTTNYFYDNPVHSQLTRVELTDSKGENLQTKYKYPGDEATIVNSTSLELSAISGLKTQFRYATILEKEQNRNGSLMTRDRTGYNNWGNNLIEPASFQMEFGSNAMETRLDYMAYNINNGDILQYKKSFGPPVAFQWGYNGEYPVAQVTNTGSNDIFYDSFEEGDGNSTAGDAKTGHLSHTGTYSKTLTGLDASGYTLSYWLKSSVTGLWSLQTNTITVSGSTYTISINGQIDDVRFYPTLAQMTTYTYDPLVGMTSSTDAKNQVTYYEYDPFQRLMNIKDQNGNILKHTDYHYEGQ